MQDLLIALQETGLAQGLRASRWSYPLVNVGHVLGLATLFGSILALDLRLLGLWRSVDAAALSRVLIPVAAGGLFTAIATGLLLFVVRAAEYAAMPLFWTKLLLTAAGLVNAAAVRVNRTSRRFPRTTAIISLAAWTGAIAAGRLIGYWTD